MKLNVTRVRGPLIGLGAALLAISGVAITNVATRPTSTSAVPPVMQLAQPASEEETTTTTTAAGPVVDEKAVLEAAGRAENAAGRAETAATKAEGAATKVEQIVASTTTTMPATTTTSVPVTVEPTTTTTTTGAPRQWVVVARIPLNNTRTDAPPAAATTVNLETGVLRIAMTKYRAEWQGLVWFGDTSEDRITPNQGACPPSPEARGTIIDGPRTSPDCYWRGEWPVGEHIIMAGSYDAGSTGTWNPNTGGFDGYRRGGWFAPWSYLGGEILIEEYR